MKKKTITIIKQHTPLNNMIPGVAGRRIFPTRHLHETDPFLMLDHIGAQQVGTNFKLDGDGHDHPHRGFETLTMMFSGKMNHRDSQGNQLELKSGMLQRMRAGKGIIHGGDMFSDAETGIFNEIQLWINVPSHQKMVTPQVEQAQNFNQQQIGHYQLKSYTGNLNNVPGKLTSTQPTQIAEITSKNGGQITINGLKSGDTTLIYVLEGRVSTEIGTAEQYNIIKYSPEESQLDFTLEKNTKILILSGTPINEPVVFRGPFVMNTQEEIDQAYIDYKNGKF